MRSPPELLRDAIIRHSQALSTSDSQHHYGLNDQSHAAYESIQFVELQAKFQVNPTLFWNRENTFDDCHHRIVDLSWAPANNRQRDLWT